MARDRQPHYDEGGPSAAAAPVGAPPYCIETGRSLLRSYRASPMHLPSRHLAQPFRLAHRLMQQGIRGLAL